MSKRIVVCLDGTWNSPHKIEARSDASKVFKPTNVLKMARAVRKVGSDGVLQLTYYDSGVGSQKVRKVVANRLYRWLDHKFGGVWGTGFESRIERAYSFNEKNARLYRPEKLLDYLRNTNEYDHLLSDVLKREMGKQ